MDPEFFCGLLFLLQSVSLSHIYEHDMKRLSSDTSILCNMAIVILMNNRKKHSTTYM